MKVTQIILIDNSDEHIQFLEEHLRKLESLKRILRGDHPDSVILTEAYERLSSQGVDVKL